jgi:hypothetical protein
VIGAFLRAYNDIVGDGERQDLLECAASVVGTRQPRLEPERVQRCVDLAIECYQAQPAWRRWLDSGYRLGVLLDIGDGPVERNDLDRLGYQLARLLRRAPGGRQRAVDLVMELTAMRAEPRPERATRRERRVAVYH